MTEISRLYQPKQDLQPMPLEDVDTIPLLHAFPCGKCGDIIDIEGGGNGVRYDEYNSGRTPDMQNSRLRVRVWCGNCKTSTIYKIGFTWAKEKK